MSNDERDVWRGIAEAAAVGSFFVAVIATAFVALLGSQAEWVVDVLRVGPLVITDRHWQWLFVVAVSLSTAWLAGFVWLFVVFSMWAAALQGGR